MTGHFLRGGTENKYGSMGVWEYGSMGIQVISLKLYALNLTPYALRLTPYA